MSKARGKVFEFDPVQVAGLDDSVWQKEGSSTASMGVVFSQRGEVVKSPGISPLVYAWVHKGDRGKTPVNPFTIYPIVSVGSFQRDGATDILLEFGGGIYLLEGNDLKQIASGRYAAKTPSEGSRFLQVGNLLLILNGKDGNVKWDGVKISPLGIASPPNAPIVVETDPGSGDMSIGDIDVLRGLWTTHSIKKSGSDESEPFFYKTTWYNDAGQESEGSLKSNSVTDGSLAADRRYVILVANLADTPPSDDIIGRVLYRSADDISYFEIANLPGSATDTYFDYTEPGLTLAAPLDVTGTRLPPPLSKWAFEFRGRTYYGGNVEDPLVLYYSGLIPNREAVAADNFVLISSDGSGDEITAYGLSNDYALVFTKRSTHMITHDKQEEPILSPLSRTIGAVSDRAVVSLGGKTFFVSEDGLYAFDGSRVVPLSREISGQVKSLPPGYLKDIVGWAEPAERRVYFSVVTGASKTNNEVWSIHVDTGAVSKLPFSVTAATRYKGEGIVGFGYASSKAGAQVYDLGMWGVSNSIGASSSFEGSFETRWIAGRNPQSDKTYYRLDVFYVQTANKDMTVSWQTDWDRDLVGTTTFSLSDPSALTWNETLSDGTTRKWDGTTEVKTWDEARVRCKRISFSVTDETTYPSGSPLTAKSLKINFSTSGRDTPWKLVGFMLHYDDHGVRGEGTDS
jgi:hypothetical protein